jgi:hypothetical protein
MAAGAVIRTGARFTIARSRVEWKYGTVELVLSCLGSAAGSFAILMHGNRDGKKGREAPLKRWEWTGEDLRMLKTLAGAQTTAAVIHRN